MAASPERIKKNKKHFIEQLPSISLMIKLTQMPLKPNVYHVQQGPMGLMGTLSKTI